MFFQVWFVKPGDTVAQSDNICEMQSNKASVTITSKYDGVLTKLYYGVDDIAQTGDPLVDVEIAGSGAEPEPVATPAEEEAEAPKVRNVKGLATPSVRRVALEYEVSQSGKEGRVLKEDILSHVASKTPVQSPAHTAPAYSAATPAAAPAPTSAKPASRLPVRSACAWDKKH